MKLLGTISRSLITIVESGTNVITAVCGIDKSVANLVSASNNATEALSVTSETLLKRTKLEQDAEMAVLRQDLKALKAPPKAA